MTNATNDDPLILIQNVAMPDPELCGDDDMFFRREAGVTLDLSAGALSFRPGATASFDTYFNLFNLGVWSVRTRLAGLTLRLEGSGRVAVQVVLGQFLNEAEGSEPERKRKAVPQPALADRDARLTRDRTVIFEAEVSLAEEGVLIPLAVLLGAESDAAEVPAQTGLLHVQITGLEDGVRLDRGAWIAAAPNHENPIRLLMSVTSFRREAETEATARRITAFIDAEVAALGIAMDVLIVDNGQSLDLPEHPHLRVVPNANLGGAGGFARGLAEARTGRYSHALFCDDDAAFMVESLRRTIAFLRLSRSSRAAVAGAMISAGAPWVIWENGAVFDRVCRPQFMGSDLRRADEVGVMEIKSARAKPHNFYGGWWYFCFPVGAVTHDPFPFFVRGDDISFSLANDFEIATINGVVSFQEAFSAKESPLNLYLDVRNHLHHHLVHPKLEIGALGTAKLAMRFILRAVSRMHYETAEAELAAWQDVMQGPAFFENNVDMEKRRPEIQALIEQEAWRDMAPLAVDTPAPVDRGLVRGRILRATLNGHLVPFWGALGTKVIVPISQRAQIWAIWGAREVTFYDASGARGYTVRHDKRRGWSIIARAGATAWRWYRRYPALRTAHRAGYEKMTKPGFWQAQFDMRLPGQNDASADVEKQHIDEN